MEAWMGTQNFTCHTNCIPSHRSSFLPKAVWLPVKYNWNNFEWPFPEITIVNHVLWKIWFWGVNVCKTFQSSYRLKSFRTFPPQNNAMHVPYNQSHYTQVARWAIFIEQKLRFGLVLGQLAMLKKISADYDQPLRSSFSCFQGQKFL